MGFTEMLIMGIVTVLKEMLTVGIEAKVLMEMLAMEIVTRVLTEMLTMEIVTESSQR